MRKLLVLAACVLATGCTSTPSTSSAAPGPAEARTSASATPTPTPTPSAVPAEVTLGLNPSATDVKVVPAVPVNVAGGALGDVVVTDATGKVVEGAVKEGKWSPSRPMAFGTEHQLLVEAHNIEGVRSTRSITFTTLRPQKELAVSMMPVNGEVVGVGMPIVLYLNTDVPTEARAAFESRLSVTPDKTVEGDWRWFNARELHWRPRTYWPAHTHVNLKTDLVGYDLGGGTYGVKDRDVKFEIGDANVSVVDTDTKQMSVNINGKQARTFPISAGREDADPTWVTRSGVHLVLSKHAEYTMDGNSAGAGDYLTDVKWATRISNSGEFVHAAPWSVPSQGKRNVSHGCVNANDENAKWFYEISQRGDVVDVKGTNRPMEPTNGLGDWVIPWEEWIRT